MGLRGLWVERQCVFVWPTASSSRPRPAADRRGADGPPRSPASAGSRHGSVSPPFCRSSRFLQRARKPEVDRRVSGSLESASCTPRWLPPCDHPRAGPRRGLRAGWAGRGADAGPPDSVRSCRSSLPSAVAVEPGTDVSKAGSRRSASRYCSTASSCLPSLSSAIAEVFPGVDGLWRGGESLAVVFDGLGLVAVEASRLARLV